MASISELFIQSQLSLAAYAVDLCRGMERSDYIDELIKGGMSLTQATSFADEYTVIDQYTDEASGFSGVVFEDTSGKIFMAIRGTEPTAFSTDWPTNDQTRVRSCYLLAG